MKAQIFTQNLTNGTISNLALESETFTFNGGEEHIRFTNTEQEANSNTTVLKIVITTRLVTSNNVMQLLLAVDALRRIYGSTAPIELNCAYFPYARQDRVCNTGEALGAKVFADIINGLNLAKVIITDAHSDVVPALLNNVVNRTQLDTIKQNEALYNDLVAKQFTLVAPDAGASKKTQNLAKALGGLEVVQAEKIRDTQTGAITSTELHSDVQGKDLMIIDDICDGGRTFIELAKVAKAKGCTSVSLYVTHGIFSKGLDVFDGLIDAIYTTDSFHETALVAKANNVVLRTI
jgi:ribose-phosphate pyrophosphokinase